MSNKVRRAAFASLIVVIVGVLLLIFYRPNEQSRITTVRVGYLPSLAAAQMYVALDKGYFKDEGLEVKIQEIYSGPEVIQALQSRSIDIGFGVVPSVVLARSNGVAVRCLVGVTTDSSISREHRLIVKADNQVQDIRDLIGKRIALVAEPTSDGLSLFQFLEKHDILRSVELVKTPHPEMVAAVSSGIVTAAAAIEPFITEGRLAGKTRELMYYYPDEVTEVGTYIVHDDWMQVNQNTSKRFSNAIKRATAWILADPDRLRERLPHFVQIGVRFSVSEQAASVLHLPGFGEAPTEEGISSLVNQLIQYEFLKEPLDPQLVLVQEP